MHIMIDHSSNVRSIALLFFNSSFHRILESLFLHGHPFDRWGLYSYSIILQYQMLSNSDSKTHVPLYNEQEKENCDKLTLTHRLVSARSKHFLEVRFPLTTLKDLSKYHLPWIFRYGNFGIPISVNVPQKTKHPYRIWVFFGNVFIWNNFFIGCWVYWTRYKTPE